jgi:hypothetical protein
VEEVDRVIASIIAGLVVTVIGAILAFYFGGVREKQRQIHERQLEEQRQREEERDQQIERQRELGERRLEALSEIRTSARSRVEDLRSLAERVARHIVQLPDATEAFQTWAIYLNEYEELAQQNASISSDMASLRAYYQKYEPYFETTTRYVIEAFNEEFERQHALLSKYLYAGNARHIHQQMKEWFDAKYHPLKIFGVALQVATLGGLNWGILRNYRKDMQEEFSYLTQAIESIQNWNFEAHEAAFDEEFKRIAGSLQ